MKIATATVRILLGLMYLFSAVNAFLQLVPMPPYEGKAGVFIQGLFSAGYFFPFLKIVEMVAAVLLLAGRYMPLALVMLLPVTVNILLFHIFLHPGGSVVAVALTAANLFLAYSYRDRYVPLLKAR
jgi:putative oxidoreductase